VTKRVFLAGLVAGIAMYAWSSIAHIVTPLGQVGISTISNEQPVLDALRAALGSANGLYMYPGADMSGKLSMSETMAQYEKKLATNPSGMLIYHPPGGKAMETGQLIVEFLTELVQAMAVVFLLSLTRLTSFGGKVGFVTLVGVLAAIATNIPYWNWYGYPTNYTITYMFVEVVGYLVVGVVAGLMLKQAT
jgi:hypothetical protein